VDLRTWVIDEHDSVRARFGQAIAPHVPPDRWRDRAGDAGSSIAWLLLHTAWHEDLAVQTAVQGHEPLMTKWREPLQLIGVAPAGGLGEAEQPDVTAALDLEALGAYRAAVQDATAAWLTDVDLATFDDVPPASARITDLADVTKADVPWLHSMWDAKPAGWFVQWEAVGHVQNHLGEMISLRSRLGLSPF
jgi:hypothetical protein